MAQKPATAAAKPKTYSQKTLQKDPETGNVGVSNRIAKEPGETNPLTRNQKFEKFINNNSGKFLIADLAISLGSALAMLPFLLNNGGGGGGDANKDGKPDDGMDMFVQALPWLVICICSTLCCCCMCVLLLIAMGSSGDGGGNSNGKSVNITV